MTRLDTIAELDQVTAQRAAATISDLGFNEQQTDIYLAGVLLGLMDPEKPTVEEVSEWAEAQGFVRPGKRKNQWQGELDTVSDEGFAWLTFVGRTPRTTKATIKAYGFAAVCEDVLEEASGRRRNVGKARAPKRQMLGWRIELADVDTSFDFAEVA